MEGIDTANNDCDNDNNDNVAEDVGNAGASDCLAVLIVAHSGTNPVKCEGRDGRRKGLR